MHKQILFLILIFYFSPFTSMLASSSNFDIISSFLQKHSEGWQFHPLRLWDKETALYPSTLWGPTCDSGDFILNNFMLPEMHSEEFILAENVGAYCSACQTLFNQIALSTPYYIYCE